jgi:hypothetical protein
MISKTSQLLSIVLSIALITPLCKATSHAFVMSDKGDVWLVSDTLSVNFTSSFYLRTLIKTKSTACKVNVQRGRMIFIAGSFNSASLLHQDLADLPFESPNQKTIDSIDKLMWKHRAPFSASTSPTYSDKNAGVIQVTDGVYSAKLTSLLNDLRIFNQDLPLTVGVPYGFETEVIKAHDAAVSNPVLRKLTAEHPEAELLKILEREASQPNSDVGPPFTIFQLHKDGTISDHSTSHVCKVPVDAAHASLRKTRRTETQFPSQR